MSDCKPQFEALVDAHSRELYIYLWRMLLNEQDAEDCLQDTYLRALKAYPRLPDDANTRAWLYKIATNVARTQLKQGGRRAARTTEVDLKLIADGRPATAEQVDLHISLEIVAAEVRKLPHKQQAALVMRKYQHLEYNEIAESLGTSEDSARANVYQALRKLRAALSEQVQVP